MQVDIVLSGLAQGGLYATNLGNLTADVEVDKFQAVVHAHVVEFL